MGGETAGGRAANTQPTFELEHKQQVRQLRLAVDAPAAVAPLAPEIVEVDAPKAVRAAAHRHDSGVLAAFHCFDEEPCQGEMAEVVGAELKLEAVLSHAPRGEDARV